MFEESEDSFAVSENDSEDDCCCVCLDADCDALLLPCGHNELCGACANMLLGNNYPERRRCPLCRTPIASITIVSEGGSSAPVRNPAIADDSKMISQPRGAAMPMRLGASPPAQLQIGLHVHGSAASGGSAGAAASAPSLETSTAEEREAAAMSSALQIVLDDEAAEGAALQADVDIALSPEQRARRLARIQAIYGINEEGALDMAEEHRIELGLAQMQDEVDRRVRAQQEAGAISEHEAYQRELAAELERAAVDNERRLLARAEKKARAARRRQQRRRRQKERCRIGKCGGPMGGCKPCRKSKCPRDCFGRHGGEYKPTLMTYLRYYFGIGKIAGERSAAGGAAGGGARASKGRWRCCKGYNRRSTHCDGVYKGRRILPLSAIMTHESSVGPDGEFFAENAEPPLLASGGGGGTALLAPAAGARSPAAALPLDALSLVAASPSPSMRAAAAATSPTAMARASLSVAGDGSPRAGGFSGNRTRRRSTGAMRARATSLSPRRSTAVVPASGASAALAALGRSSARVVPIVVAV